MKIMKFVGGVVCGYALMVGVARGDNYIFNELGDAYLNSNPWLVGTPVWQHAQLIPDPTIRTLQVVPVWTLPISYPNIDILMDDQFVQGDGGPVQDIISIRGNQLIFYSASADLHPYEGDWFGINRIAWADLDSPGNWDLIYNNIYPNNVLIHEVGFEWMNYAVWNDGLGNTFTFYSDIPEPSAVGLLALGGLALIWRKRS
jgi:hypothetical protein